MPLVALIDLNPNRTRIEATIASISDDIRVEVFQKTTEALKAFRRVTPDAVFIGASLGTQSCEDLIRAIRATTGLDDIPLAFMCDVADVEARLNALEAGASELISYPPDALELIVRVHAMLRISLTQRELERTRDRHKMIDGRYAYLLRMLDQLPAKISGLDKNGRFVLVNAAMAVAAGSSPARMVGHQAHSFGHAPFMRPRSTADLQVLATGTTSTAHEMLDLGQGENVPHLTLRAPLLDLNRDIVGVLTCSVQTEAPHAGVPNRMDSLTGVQTRDGLIAALEEQIAITQGTGVPFAVHILVLSGLNDINHSFGRMMGDKVLEAAAHRMAGVLGGGDTSSPSILRMSGNSFAVLQPGLDSASKLTRYSERMCSAFEQAFIIAGEEIDCPVHHGAAVYPNHGTSVDDLLMAAEQAMYSARAQGEASLVNEHETISLAIQHPADPRATVRNALQSNQLELHYQPQVNLELGRVVGVEALLRWNRPGSGLIGPGELLALAKQSEQSADVTAWVLARAFAQLRELHDAGLSDLRLAINLQVDELELVLRTGLLLEFIRHAGLRPETIDIEIAQPDHIPADMMPMLETARQIGLHLTLDNWDAQGLAQFSNVSAITRLKCAIHRMDDSTLHGLKALRLARGKTLKLIGAQVEQASQLEQLREFGFDEAQGHYFHRPILADELVVLMRSGEI